MRKLYNIFQHIPKTPKIATLILILGSCTLLTTLNYYSFKVLSANRAYVNGESYYSKGHKAAVHSILRYIYDSDSTALERFHSSIAVPVNDNIARDLMEKDGPDSLVRKALLIGKNHKDDLSDIIWIFKTFGSMSYMKEVINSWHKGDSFLTEIRQIADEIVRKKQTGTLTQAEQNLYSERIIKTSAALDVNSDTFSELIGQGSRDAKKWLFYINLFFILIIVGNIGSSFLYMLNNQIKNRALLMRHNEELLTANKELDRFVYSVSHELRAPLSSLMGLIEMAHTEDNPQQLKEYIRLMSHTAARQDEYIKQIITFSQNKQEDTRITTVNLDQLIDEVISQHRCLVKATDIRFIKELSEPDIMTDRSRLHLILNNLISNAIKYTDESKEEKIVAIKSYSGNKCYNIEVFDNGVGIEEKYLGNIFDMFFRLDNKGTGLGLYLTYEAVKNIRGCISVRSSVKEGSTFIVTVPRQMSS